MKSCADIAAALAETLNADDLDAEFSIAFTAEATDGPPELGRTLGAPRVVCYGLEEGEEVAFDRGGGVKATRVANVVVQCPVGERFSLAMCLAWLNEIKEAIRELVLLDTWFHEQTETVTPYDSDRLAEQRQFVCLFKVTFFDFC